MAPGVIATAPPGLIETTPRFQLNTVDPPRLSTAELFVRLLGSRLACPSGSLHSAQKNVKKISFFGAVRVRKQIQQIQAQPCKFCIKLAVKLEVFFTPMTTLGSPSVSQQRIWIEHGWNTRCVCSAVNLAQRTTGTTVLHALALKTDLRTPSPVARPILGAAHRQ